VLLPASTCGALMALRGVAGADSPVFPSRSGGGHLSKVSVDRIVKAAAKRAGLPTGVSAHWLRHAHASHSLDCGAPISLVPIVDQQRQQHGAAGCNRPLRQILVKGSRVTLGCVLLLGGCVDRLQRDVTSINSLRTEVVIRRA